MILDAEPLQDALDFFQFNSIETVSPDVLKRRLKEAMDPIVKHRGGNFKEDEYNKVLLYHNIIKNALEEDPKLKNKVLDIEVSLMSMIMQEMVNVDLEDNGKEFLVQLPGYYCKQFKYPIWSLGSKKTYVPINVSIPEPLVVNDYKFIMEGEGDPITKSIKPVCTIKKDSSIIPHSTKVVYINYEGRTVEDIVTDHIPEIQMIYIRNKGIQYRDERLEGVIIHSDLFITYNTV